MKAFTEPLLSLAGFEEMTKTAEKSSGLISVTGCIDAQKITDDICLWRSQEKQAYCDLWRAEGEGTVR